MCDSPLAVVRESQVQQVLLLRVIKKLTTQDACEEVGISVDQFYYWFNKTDAKEFLRNAITIDKLERLHFIRIAIQEGLLLLSQDAANPAKQTADRLGAMNMLLRVLNEDIASLNVQPGIEEEAQKFLTSPKTRKIPSKMVSIEVDETPTGVNIDVSKYQDVIDITPSDD